MQKYKINTVNIKVYLIMFKKKNQEQGGKLILLKYMKDKWMMGTQMDGAELFIEMEAIIQANLIILQQKRAKSMTKMEIKYMKKFIKFMIDIYKF